MEDLIAPDALEWLITYSGGHARHLVTFVREACTYIRQAPITLDAAQKAVGQTVRLYSTSIPLPHWPKLARLECSADQLIDNNDPDYRKMLEQVCVMEYTNGGREDDPFNPAAPWYGVNPIVRELRPFREAVAALKQDDSTTDG